MAIGFWRIGLHMQALTVVVELWPWWLSFGRGRWRMRGCGWGRRRVASADDGRAVRCLAVDF